jgi:gamma-glutamylcyclotransferase
MALPVFGKAHEAKAAGPGFTWFVYGSSLDRAAFAEWAGSHGYQVPPFDRAVPARLNGYRLAFDVVSRHWGGAVASVAEAPGHHVEGLALPLPGEARGLVDHKEGSISGLYTAFEAPLHPVAGGPPVMGLVYRAARSRRLPVEAAPSPAYLEAMVRGARACGLSAEWLARLEKLGR